MPSLTKNNLKSGLTLLGFILLVVGVGGLIGVSTAPAGWYAGLEKPFFNPPSWIFAPVWTVLYVMIGTAGWLIWSKAPHSDAFKIWGGQQVLNWLWSPVFFVLHQTWLAAAIIVSLLGMIVFFIRKAKTIDKRASWLFVPYALWVAFASLLNISIAVLN